MNKGDRVVLNKKVEKLPEPQRSQFKPGDKGVIEGTVGTLYIKVAVEKKGTLRCPRGWVDHG